jgi:hypothetical protein
MVLIFETDCGLPAEVLFTWRRCEQGSVRAEAALKRGDTATFLSHNLCVNLMFDALALCEIAK